MSSLVTVCPQDLSETETTLVVPFCIEDGMESPPLTPPLNRVTVGVVTPAWPETLPARSRLAPIQNLSAKAKKLLQGGLEELQQVGHYHHRQIYDDIHC